MRNYRAHKNRRFSRKSQAAMEFLMTYGWAILVVLVAIGALAYFGVLSPDKFLPSKCQLPSGIACSDHSLVGGGAATVVIRNGLGYDINTVDVSIANCGTLPAIASGDCPLGGETTLNNGDQCTYQIAGCTPALVAGAKFSEDLVLTYVNVDSGLTHTSSGTITTRIQ